MRTLIILPLLFVLAASHAQFTMSATGGWNGAQKHIVSNQWNDGNNAAAGGGWQAGLETMYQFKRIGVYSGLGVTQNDIIGQYPFEYDAYKPVFLTLPFGIYHTYTLAKNFSLRWYAGFYGSYAVGGKYYSKAASLCDFAPCPEIFYNPVGANNKMQFGNHASNGDEMVHANWGAQAGLGVEAWRRFELECVYNYGLSSLLPADAVGGKLYLRSVSLNVKVGLKTFAPALKK